MSDATSADGQADLPRLEGFDDLSEIGRGGFSVVFAATQTAFDRRVAVKVLSVSGDEARRCEREARALGRLSDLPHIVQAHQVLTTTDGRPALVMSLMPTSLGRRIKEHGGAPPADALRWLDQVARALDGAHALGVYHRDIKPENVLLSAWGDAHLADFGIAGIDDVLASTTTALSFSPPHAPPERLTDNETDLRAGDLYSLASTFYTVLTGRAPFGTTADGGVYGLTQRVVADALPCPPGLPPAAHRVLARAMAKSPDERYTSAAEFAADLRAAYGQEAGTDTGNHPLPAARVVLDSPPPAAPADATRRRDGSPTGPPEPAPAVAAAIPPGAAGTIVDAPPAAPPASTPPPWQGPPPAGTGPTVLPGGPAAAPGTAAPGPTVLPGTRVDGGDGGGVTGPPTGPPPVPPGGQQRRRRRSRVLMVGVGVLVLAIAGVVVWAMRTSTVDPPPVPVAAGGVHACSVGADGKVRCWGSNSAGQLGNDAIGAYSVLPTEVTDLGAVTWLATGNVHSCAVDADGRVLCWGRGERGQLGDGLATSSGRPVAVRGLGPATAVTAGREHSCALLRSGDVWCWGRNDQGQLGAGSPDGEPVPVQVEGLPRTKAIAAGNAFTCALATDGTVRCWGDGQFGQLGALPDGTSGSPSPVQVDGVEGATAIAAAAGHVCVLDPDGVACWGSNGTGELGADPAATPRSTTPVRVPGTASATAVTAGGSLTGNAATQLSTAGHTCALLADRTLVCWGDDRYGQLGDGSTTSSWQPVAVKGLDDVVAVAAGGGPKPDENNDLTPHSTTCAYLADNSTWCWGDNNWGQLGDGTRTASKAPVKVPTDGQG